MMHLIHIRCHHFYLAMIIIIGRLKINKSLIVTQGDQNLSTYYLGSECSQQPDHQVVANGEQVKIALKDLEDPPWKKMHM